MDRSLGRARRLSPAAVFVLALAVLGGTPSPGRANKDKASELYNHGMASFVLEQWDGAIRDFEEGFKEFPNPAFLYNIAQAQDRAHRPAEAVRYYHKYLEFSPHAKDRAAVQKEIARLDALAPVPPGAPAATAASPQRADTAPAPVVATVAPASVSSGVREPGAARATEPPPSRAADPSTAIESSSSSRAVEPGAASPEVTVRAIETPPAPVVEPRRPIGKWIALAVGGVVVVAGVIGIVVAVTTPKDAPIPGGTIGNVDFSMKGFQ